MPGTTVRIGEETRKTLRDLERETGYRTSELLARAVEQYRRSLILDLTNRAYAALRADPEAWAEVEAERGDWDATLGDGLEDDPTPSS